jgi:cupredoxin-like protein
MKRRRFIQALVVGPAFVVAAAEPASQVFAIHIANGRVDPPHGTVRIGKGTRVELRLTSDRPMALHLHGYDIEARVTPQSPAVMAFTAAITGRFPISEHTSNRAPHRALLYLEVHP